MYRVVYCKTSSHHSKPSVTGEHMAGQAHSRSRNERAKLLISSLGAAMYVFGPVFREEHENYTFWTLSEIFNRIEIKKTKMQKLKQNY